MDGCESCEYILSDGIMATLDKIFNSYKQDKARIRERIELYLQYSSAGYTLTEIERMMTNPSTRPPVLMRITMTLGLRHNGMPENAVNTGERLWSVSEVAIILQRHRTTTHYNISRMEAAPAYKDRLENVRTEVGTADESSDKSKREYRYREEIFDLMLDYCSRQCVTRRVVVPKYGDNPKDADSLHAIDAIWKYWNSLITDSAKSSLPGAKTPTKDLSFADEGCNSLVFSKEADDMDFIIPLNILSEAVLPNPLPRVNASEIPVRLKRLLIDCVSIIRTNKFISVASGLLVTLADLRGNDIRVFYLVPAVIAPAIAAMFYKARGEADAGKRRKYTACLAYCLVAAAAWGFSFSGRALNGNLSESALPDIVHKMESLTGQMEETKAQVTVITSEIEEVKKRAEERTEVRKANVTEFITDVRAFIDRASEDMSGIGSYDYEAWIERCFKMLDTMPGDMPEERVRILIAQGDLYQLWGMTDAGTAYSKYENAVSTYVKASKIKGISDDALTDIYAGLGNLYVIMGDKKSQDKNIKRAEEALNEARKYIDGADDETKISYYMFRGQLLTARTETGKMSPEATKKSLEESIDYLTKAEGLAEKNKKMPGLLRTLRIIRTELSLAEGKLSGLLSLTDADAAAKFCMDAIDRSEEELKSINIEEDLYSYVGIKQRIAELSLRLDDILQYNLANQLMASKQDAEAVKDILTERLKILDKGCSAAGQAIKFNNGSVDQGHLYDLFARITSRFAILTKDKKLCDEAVKLLDAALKEYPERENLRCNIYVTVSKVTVLYNVGISMKIDEYLKEAGRISRLYLKEYSSTGYDSAMDKFKEIAEQCGD